jgi:trans-aconitate 2-methyltransferase
MAWAVARGWRDHPDTLPWLCPIAFHDQDSTVRDAAQRALAWVVAVSGADAAYWLTYRLDHHQEEMIHTKASPPKMPAVSQRVSHSADARGPRGFGARRSIRAYTEDMSDDPDNWDAETYDELPLPHERWGRRTRERLMLTGSETVLDAGCGTGRETVALLEALPAGRVVAVDASSAMLGKLRERLAFARHVPDRLGRVDIVQADLATPLPLATQTVDAVFSVAAFHWILDHRVLFGNLAQALRPGGQLVFECGGEGNVATVLAASEQVLGDVPVAWNFAGTETTAVHLTEAGFVDVEVALVPDPVASTIRRRCTNIYGRFCSAPSSSGFTPASRTRSPARSPSACPNQSSTTYALPSPPAAPPPDPAGVGLGHMSRGVAGVGRRPPAPWQVDVRRVPLPMTSMRLDWWR